jgi:hypothetical protein
MDKEALWKAVNDLAQAMKGEAPMASYHPGYSSDEEEEDRDHYWGTPISRSSSVRYEANLHKGNNLSVNSAIRNCIRHFCTAQKMFCDD